MKDKDRYPLLFGPYRIPYWKRGDDAFCELRGSVVICCSHQGPIGPWPKGRRGRQRAASIVLAGDLVRAVRNEALVTVCYWWDGGRDTVWRWRRVLGVPGVNDGTSHLLAEQFRGPIGDKARAAGYPTLKSRERAAKSAAALRGRPIHPQCAGGAS